MPEEDGEGLNRKPLLRQPKFHARKLDNEPRRISIKDVSAWARLTVLKAKMLTTVPLTTPKLS